MRAHEITEAICDAISSKSHDFVLAPANADMVGHSGQFSAIMPSNT